LIAGFASTVGWPLSSLGLETIGWRGTCYGWAAAHIVIGLPLNLFFLPRAARSRTRRQTAYSDGPHDDPAVFRLRRCLDGDLGNGGALAAHRRGVRRNTGASRFRWQDDRTGSSGGARSRGEHAQ
jgi:hypothetical protein